MGFLLLQTKALTVAHSLSTHRFKHPASTGFLAVLGQASKREPLNMNGNMAVHSPVQLQHMQLGLVELCRMHCC